MFIQAGKLLFCLTALIGLSLFESERLQIPLRGFFSYDVSVLLSRLILGTAVLISVFGNGKASFAANGIIFLLILSSYGADLKAKYHKILDDGRVKTMKLVQREKDVPKVPDSHKCKRDKDPELRYIYTECIARFNKSVKKAEKLAAEIEAENLGIRTANGAIKDQTDWNEFYMQIFNGIIIAAFFWIATLFFCRISKGAIESIRELHKVKDKDKAVIIEVQKKQETIADKLKRIPDIEAIDLILEQGLFYCIGKKSNDRSAALALYEHKGLTEKFETYYRRLKRQREIKKTVPRLKVVNGGKG